MFPAGILNGTIKALESMCSPLYCNVSSVQGLTDWKNAFTAHSSYVHVALLNISKGVVAVGAHTGTNFCHNVEARLGCSGELREQRLAYMNQLHVCRPLA